MKFEISIKVTIIKKKELKIMLGKVWDRFGINYEKHWKKIGIKFGQIWEKFGKIYLNLDVKMRYYRKFIEKFNNFL